MKKGNTSARSEKPWEERGMTEKDYRHILSCAFSIRCMAEEGWCPATGGMPWDADAAEAQSENRLAWLAKNQDDDNFAEEAGEWLKYQIYSGKHDPAGRLSRALLTGKIRMETKVPEVLCAVADFMKSNFRWPTRVEISIEGVSERTRDLAFEQITEKFGIRFDARERWVDPQ
jgi:hypothetical protein